MMTAIVAAGIAAFIFIYFAAQVNEKEHFILRLLLFSFGIILLIFLGKGAIDGQQTCINVLNSTEETYIYGANYTGYHYDDYGGPASPSLNDLNLFHKNTTYTYGVHCYDTKESTTTGTILYKTLLYMFVIYVAYILFYFVYWMFNFTKKFMRR